MTMQEQQETPHIEQKDLAEEQQQEPSEPEEQQQEPSEPEEQQQEPSEQQQQETVYQYVLSFQTGGLKLACCCKNEWRNYVRGTNYLKGVSWSPDGTCLLCNSEDRILRLFEFPFSVYQEQQQCQFNSLFQIPHAETIYDYSWFPRMISTDPSTCCFLSTSRDHPVQLWDAFSGKLRTSYRAYDGADELTSAYSVCFSPCGSKLYGGFHQQLRIWDSSRPGRNYFTLDTFKKPTKHPPIKSFGKQPSVCQKTQRRGLPGIISCISVSLDNLVAAGSYFKSTMLYSADLSERIASFEGHCGGVTQVKFSPDGRYLLTGARKDNSIICWDLRNFESPLFFFERSVTTNQRLTFDISPCGSFLFSGSQDGILYVYNLRDGSVISTLEGHNDTINGISIHPSHPLLATTTGQRHLEDVCTKYRKVSLEGCSSYSQKKEIFHSAQVLDNSLRVWTLPHTLQLIQR